VRHEGWGYCTEFLIGGPGLDVDALREELGALGDSSLVVGDEELVRVHIHTHDPAVLITRAAERGRLSKLKVEDMSIQHHDILERAAAEEAQRPPAPHKALGVVSVAPDPGGDLASNCARMEEAIGGVVTVEITHAVRDSTADGQDIHEGDVIAVVDDRITQVGRDHLSVVEAVLDHAGREPELITVYR